MDMPWHQRGTGRTCRPGATVVCWIICTMRISPQWTDVCLVGLPLYSLGDARGGPAVARGWLGQDHASEWWGRHPPTCAVAAAPGDTAA